MKILPAFLFVSLLLSESLLAQSDKTGLTQITLYTETFDETAKKWTKSDTNVDSFFVETGSLHWLTKSPQPGLLAQQVSRLTSKREHTIRARFVRKEMGSSHRVMILFGYKDNANYWAIALKRQEFELYGREDGSMRQLLPPQKCSALRDTNEVRIEHRINKVEFYINDQLAHTYPRPIHYIGDAAGFGQQGYGHLWLDFLEVQQWDAPINLLPDADLFGSPERLPVTVNTKYPDYVPLISHDGQQLYFVRRDAPNIMGNNKAKSDIFVSPLQKDGTWGEAEQLGEPINNAYNNAICAIMPDNNALYLLNKYFENGDVAPGFALTRRSAEGWSFPVNQEVENLQNKSKYADYFVTPNGKVLLLSVEADQTYGERDLYVSFALGEGKWSAPRNMGKVINSESADFAPFLAADGKTLYFSSIGHPGFGGADVFVSRRLDDTWLNWEKPYNLGSRVNTASFEAYYTIPAQGDYAYYVSNSVETKSDIYRIPLAPSARPEKVVVVEGYVKDQKTKEPLSAMIQYESLSAQKNLGVAYARADGFYQIILPYGDHYGIMGEYEGYFPVSAELDLNQKTAGDTAQVRRIRRDLYLNKLSKNEPVRLNNVFFDSGKHDLLPSSVSELQRLLRVLQARPNLVIQLEGHTDNQGTDKNNQALSERRVQSVSTYLISQGIKADRIKTLGCGRTRPVADNGTEAGRAENRRVEFRILSGD